MIPAGLFRRHFQIAYVAWDVHSAMARFRERFGVANWQLMKVSEQMDGAPIQYIALAYAGDVMIELIEPIPGRESIYQGWLEGAALRLHHLGFLAETGDDWSQAVATLRADGVRIAAEGAFGEQLNFLYADTVAELGHYYELIHLKPRGRDFFAHVPRN